MFKHRFLDQLMSFGMWYGLFTLAFDAANGKFAPLIVLVSMAALMAWAKR